MLTSYAFDEVTRRLAAYASAVDSDEPGSRAAVAAILRAGAEGGGGEAEILFVRRAEHPTDPWSGHMALPGGRRDPSDATLADTAMREVLEEVGIDLLREGVLLARLPDHPAIFRGNRVGLVIAPFVFALRGDPEVRLNDEIAETIWTPLGPLARGEVGGTFPLTHGDEVFDVPFHDVRGRRVWGLTYQMLQKLFHALHA